MDLRPIVQLVSSEQLAPGVPYAYAAVVEPSSRLVLTAGACPLDAAGATVAVGDVAGQTEQVMVNLLAALQAAGANLGDVARVNIYVATNRQDDLYAASRVVHRHLGEHEPSSTLLGVTVLGYPDQLVEVEVIAALSSDSPADPRARHRSERP